MKKDIKGSAKTKRVFQYNQVIGTRILKIAGRLFTGFLLLGFVFYLSVLIGLFGSIPSRSELRSVQNSAPSEVYSSDGILLGRFFIQDRSNVSYSEISANVIAALIATEDARFYKHHGIDTRSLLRVFFKTLLLQEENSGGGSTLSQQLAKNLYPRKNYRFFSTAVNKVREMIIANRLEQVYSKEEILELYLNTVPMGGNVYGIERAANRFFNKPATKLKIQEAAVLVGMLKATTLYNPKNYPERSLQRRNVVISQMVKYGFLKKEKADSLKNLPLKLDYNSKSADEDSAPYFVEHLRLELQNWCDSTTNDHGENYNLYTDGLKIYTTIDSRIQHFAERAVRNRMSALQALFNRHWAGKSPWGNNSGFLQSAVQQSLRYQNLKTEGTDESEIEAEFKKPVKMKIFTWSGYRTRTLTPLDSVRYYQKLLNTGLLSVEPRTGYIKAWVGGIDYQSFKYDHVLSRRQVGSTFKPIVYAAALEQGLEPCQYFRNERLSYPAYQNWSPQNADGQYGGEYSMRGALAHSVNTVSAQILLQTGIQATIDLAHRLGIKNQIPKVPSIALGTADLSLFEMVSAYTTLANLGKRREPVYILKIKDRYGKVLKQHVPDYPVNVLSADNARIMIELMKGVVEDGSASRLRSEYKLNMDIAGKTGTTQNHADGWFIGISPSLVTGVWVGAESPLVHFRTLALGQGANTALPIWADFMKRLCQSPDFSHYSFERFDPLSPETAARLSCASFRYEEPPVHQVRESFFDRLFKGKKNNAKGRKKKWKLFGGGD